MIVAVARATSCGVRSMGRRMRAFRSKQTTEPINRIILNSGGTCDMARDGGTNNLQNPISQHLQTTNTKKNNPMFCGDNKS